VEPSGGGSGAAAAATAPSAFAPPSGLPAFPPDSGPLRISAEPMDQPYPFPDQFWPGLRDVYKWITPTLARQWGGTGGMSGLLSGCNILMGGDELVQTVIGGQCNWVTDGARFSRRRHRRAAGS
jgi:hypothetical protein